MGPENQYEGPAHEERAGKVKWFDERKGYGFLIDDETQGEMFVHHTKIKMEGYRTLKDDRPVTFKVKFGPKGPQAYNVVRL